MRRRSRASRRRGPLASRTRPWPATPRGVGPRASSGDDENCAGRRQAGGEVRGFRAASLRAFGPTGRRPQVVRRGGSSWPPAVSAGAGTSKTAGTPGWPEQRRGRRRWGIRDAQVSERTAKVPVPTFDEQLDRGPGAPGDEGAVAVRVQFELQMGREDVPEHAQSTPAVSARVCTVREAGSSDCSVDLSDVHARLSPSQTHHRISIRP